MIKWQSENALHVKLLYRHLERRSVVKNALAMSEKGKVEGEDILINYIRLITGLALIALTVYRFYDSYAENRIKKRAIK